MILCDTDIMIEFIKGKFEIIGNLFRIQENLPMIPILTLQEDIRACLKS